MYNGGKKGRQKQNVCPKLPGKDSPIVLYCRSGSRSTLAAMQLASPGSLNVLELEVEMWAWAAAGDELVYRYVKGRDDD